MTPARKKLLDDLGFNWEVRSVLRGRQRASWQQRLEQLTEFHQIHGHFRVPVAELPQLLEWCRLQRTKLRTEFAKEQRALLPVTNPQSVTTTKRMKPEQAKALHDLGFTKDVDLGGSCKTSTTVGVTQNSDLENSSERSNNATRISPQDDDINKDAQTLAEDERCNT